MKKKSNIDVFVIQRTFRSLVYFKDENIDDQKIIKKKNR